MEFYPPEHWWSASLSPSFMGGLQVDRGGGWLSLISTTNLSRNITVDYTSDLNCTTLALHSSKTPGNNLAAAAGWLLASPSKCEWMREGQREEGK